MFFTSETLLDHEGKLHIYLFVLCVYKLCDEYLDLWIRHRKIKSNSLVYLPFTFLQFIFFCLRQKCHWEETLKEGVGALAPLLLFASWLLLGEQLWSIRVPWHDIVPVTGPNATNWKITEQSTLGQTIRNCDSKYTFFSSKSIVSGVFHIERQLTSTDQWIHTNLFWNRDLGSSGWFWTPYVA